MLQKKASYTSLPPTMKLRSSKVPSPLPKPQPKQGSYDSIVMRGSVSDSRVGTHRRRDTEKLQGRLKSIRRRATKLTEKKLRSLEEELNMPRRKHSTSSSSASRTITTTRDFQARLADNKVNFDRPTVAPYDISDIQAFLDKRRESNSPDADTHIAYIKRVDGADNEHTMQTETWPLISKHPDTSGVDGYASNYNFEWTECDNRFTDSGLSNPKPDITESLRLRSYPWTAREQLAGALGPTMYRQALPNIAIEFKGPDGTMNQAKHQCAYDGATIANSCYEINQHLSKDPTHFYGSMQALTIASDGNNIEIFANHATQDGSDLAFHQHSLSYLPMKSLEQYKVAYKQVRNAQDWARKRAIQNRELLRDHEEALDPANAGLTVNAAVSHEGWTWSAETSKYFRIVNGKVQSSHMSLTAPASSSTSSLKKRKGKGRRQS